MAKKKQGKNKIDGDLNFDDLDDINTDDMDFGELEDIDSDRNPSKIGVAKELAGEAGKGFLDSLVTQTAKKGLPEQFSDNYYEAMDYADLAKNTFNDNVNKVNKSLFRLGKEVKKILPFQVKLLDNYLEKYQSDFEQFKQESEEALRESSIQSNLTSIFDKQLEIQKAIEAKREAENQVEARERITGTKLNIDILRSIDSNTANQTAFTLQISKEYYRKSLELQYKTYFIQSDMLKTIKDYYKGFSIQFEGILKNTGLPEFVKLNNTERIQDVIRTQMVQNTYSNLFSNSKYVESVKARMRKVVDDKISGITDKVDTVTDQLNMINSATDGTGTSAGGMVGNILSGLLGSTVGEKLGDKLGPKVKDKLKDNKYINTGANYLGMLGNSPSTLFSLLRSKVGKKQEQYSDESTPFNFLASKMFGGLKEVLDVTDPGKQEFKVASSSMLNHNKPAIFDNKVHRSITEVIPMYLAKILKENTDLRKMYYLVNNSRLSNFKTTEELYYDYTDRKLSTKDELISSVEKEILTSDKNKNKIKSTTNTMLSSSLSELKKDKSGNKEAINLLTNKKSEKLLEEYLVRASKIEGIDYNYETIIDNATNGNGPSELTSLVENNKQLKAILETLKKTSEKDKKIISEKMSDTKRKYPIYAIKELIKIASKLAGNKVFTTIKDDEAEILSRNFSNMILTGKELNIDLIRTGDVLRSFSKKDFQKTEKIMTSLISDVKKIYLSENIQNESTLMYAIGQVVSSVKSGFEKDPGVFQTLYELNPILGQKGILTEENLIEGKLFRSRENDDLVNIEDIRKVTRATKQEVTDIRSEIIESEFISNFNKGTTSAINDFKEAGMNPFKIVSAAIKNTKIAVSSVRKIAEEKYEEASKKLKSLESPMNDFIKNTTLKGQQSLIKSLDETVISIDNMLKAELLSRDEQIKNLEEAKSKLKEITEETNMKEIDREIKLLNIRFKSSIAALEELKKILKSQRDSIANIDASQFTNPAATMLKLKEQLTTTLNRVKELRDTVIKSQEASLA